MYSSLMLNNCFSQHTGFRCVLMTCIPSARLIFISSCIHVICLCFFKVVGVGAETVLKDTLSISFEHIKSMYSNSKVIPNLNWNLTVCNNVKCVFFFFLHKHMNIQNLLVGSNDYQLTSLVMVKT